MSNVARRGVLKRVGVRLEGARGVRAAACVALAFLCAAACACSSVAGEGGGASAAGRAAAATTDAGARGFGFKLTNNTGTALRGVYISRTESGGWEENLLGDGRQELADGDSVEVRFNPEEKAGAWDMRVVGVDDRYVIWNGLRLEDASRVTLHVDMAGGLVVVAEVE